MAEDRAIEDRDVAAEIRAQLGRIATGGGRDIRYLAEAVGHERVEVAAAGYHRGRGWVIAATDEALHLARRPLVVGRAAHHAFAWTALTAVRVGPARVDLVFGADAVELSAVGPASRFEALVEAARARVPGAAERQTVQELRELAGAKLGRFATWANEGAIEALPDVLEPGEVVQRMAQATLDFTGLLALTDRRLVLMLPGMRRSGDRWWETPREAVLDAVMSEQGVTMDFASGPVVLRDVFPHERAAELVAVLGRRPGAQG